MTLLPPTPPRMDMGNFPYRIDGYTNTTPFTHRDGMTFLRKLESLQHWLMAELVPHVDNSIAMYVDAFNKALDDIQTYMEGQQVIIDDKVADFVELANKAVADYNVLVTAFEAKVDAANTKIEADLAASETAAQIAHDAVDSIAAMIVTVDSFGAKGDGVTDDTASIQAAFDAVPGGVVQFGKGKTYLIQGVVFIPKEGLDIDGNGAKLIKRLGHTSPVLFGNKNGVIGYGGGIKYLNIRRLHIQGDYTAPAANYIDIVISLHHANNVLVENCVFEQGVINGHYFDLVGCSNVEIRGCRFIGANPKAGREYVEAIQVDQSYLGGHGVDWENPALYDGLPTINVNVHDNSYESIVVNNIQYPMPCLMGIHSATFDDERGYHKNIWFNHNRVKGYVAPFTSGWAQGWLHFRSVIGLSVCDNTFEFSGPAGITGSPTVVNITSVTTAVLPGNFGVANSGATITPRTCKQIVISRNTFLGFVNAPVLENQGLINAAPVNDILVSDNVCDGTKTYFYRSASSSSHVAKGNIVRYSGVGIVFETVNARDFEIDNNRIIMTAGSGTGIKSAGGGNNMITRNRIDGGETGVIVTNMDNIMIHDNLISEYGKTGISIAETAGTLWDAMVRNNRLRTSATASNVRSIIIGADATRARLAGNVLRDGGAVTDNASNTIYTATDQTA